MKKLRICMLALFCVASGFKMQAQTSELQRPKLVVGLVVDQMRWDYLYRYFDKYQNDGFKRLINEGYSLNNVHINYVPTYTAIGHTSIYTGSVPAIHGIAGNDWKDKETGKNIYCTADDSVSPVGTTSREYGSHSPKNLWSTTMTDQLRLGTNFQAKVVGVSLKDRASILPAGHNPTGAFWFDDSTGNFITSTYYMKELPQWVKNFNAQNLPEKLVAQGWDTLLPLKNYTESSPDNSPWEGLLGSAEKPVFPYKKLASDYQKKKGEIRNTPFGNTLTLKMAESAVDGEALGSDAITDFLAINLASTDYAGHKFGPNAIEVEDVYLRLDRDLAEFFKFLDAKVGKGQYSVFLTADHGGAHSVGFMEEHKMPTGFYGENLKKDLTEKLAQRFGVSHGVFAFTNNQVYLHEQKFTEKGLDFEKVKDFAVREILKDPNVLFATDVEKTNTSSIPEPIKTRIINGINWKRSGDIQIIFKDGMLSSYVKTGTTHGAWNSYDSHIPFLLMGWGIRHGASEAPYNMTDIAPTICALLHLQFPSGNIGNPVTEALMPQ